jgi:hypothetical protein
LEPVRTVVATRLGGVGSFTLRHCGETGKAGFAADDGWSPCG